MCAAGCCALRCGMLFEQGKEWKIQFEAAQKKQQQQGQGQPSLINRIVGHSDRAYEQQQQKRSMLHGSSATNAVDVSSDDDSVFNGSVLEAAGIAMLHSNMSYEDQNSFAQQLGGDSTTVDIAGHTFNVRQMTGNKRHNHNRLDKAGGEKRNVLERQF